MPKRHAETTPNQTTTHKKTKTNKQTLDTKQINKAVHAIKKHVQNKQETKNQLFHDTQDQTPLMLVLSTKKMPNPQKGAKAIKPTLLPLPNAWRTLENTRVCLFVKDPQRAVKNKLIAQQVSLTNVKVIGIDKLKKKYVPHEAKNRLRTAHDLFLVDERVVPMMPRLLGSNFFKENKLPMPVDVTKSDLRGFMDKCVGGALLRPTRGTCTSFFVANVGQPESEICSNIAAAADAAVKRVAGNWQNVQSVHLRAPNSVSLPLYNSL